MATIYPSKISTKTESHAERILFNEFERQLPSDYVVIHSKSWIEANRKGYARKQGECDFIVLHPSKGILFVEAKSGRNFFCSGLDEHWYCEDGNSFRNPFNQAVESQYAIVKDLNKSIEGFNLPYSVALAFPEADILPERLPSNLLPSMVILQPDIKNIHQKVDAALRTFRAPLSNPAPEDVFNRIIDSVRGKFHITTSLSATINNLKQQFFQLAKEQVAALDMFEFDRRVIVEGFTGSGKTLIALEKAALEARSGKRVLILCFSRIMSEVIRKRIAERNIQIEVFHFYGLVNHVIRTTIGIFPPDLPEQNSFWNKDCIELLDSAVSTFSNRYDCVIVDEVHDFFENWWIPIIKLLADENTSELYMFLDPSQNIFCRKTVVPFNCTRIKLNKNFRNTPAIVKWINKVLGSGIKSPDGLEEGIIPFEIRVKDDQSELSEIKNIVDNLLNKEKLHPSQIVILGQHALKNSIFRNVSNIGKYPIIEAEISYKVDEEIRYSSICNFKGLEADCIILSGIGTRTGVHIGQNLKDLLMIGASAARFLLYVVHRL